MKFDPLFSAGLALGLIGGIAAINHGFSQARAHEQRCQSYETELLQNRTTFVQQADESKRLLKLSSSLSTADYLPRIYELEASLERLHAKTADLMPVYRKVCGEKRFASWKEANRAQLAL